MKSRIKATGEPFVDTRKKMKKHKSVALSKERQASPIEI